MVTYRRQKSFSLFIIFLFTVIINSAKLLESRHGSTKLKLIHRHDFVRDLPVTQLDRLRQLLHSDSIRLRSISHKIRLNHPIRRQVQEKPVYYPACTNSSSRAKNDYNVAAELPIHSGAEYGTGQYFVHFRVGSPAQTLALIADTGSDLTWMKCKYRCHGGRGKCRRNSNKKRVFRADRSLSFRTVPCSSTVCKVDLANLFSLARCPSPKYPCAYDYRYSDGSSALGLFANETVTFSLTNGRKTRLHNVLVGCSESTRGQSFQAADGVIGLGYSNHSFALRAAEKFGDKFSYCLVDHLSPKNISSYLIFGSHKDEPSIPLNRIQYTELVLGVIAPFYAVNVKGISIGGIMLEIPAEIWNVNGVGGVIVDSGSSLTFLAQPAYQPVMAALKLSLINFRNLNLDLGPIEYCFNSRGFDESLVPRLVIHFTDGARFEPPVKSYVIDAAPGVKCLGFGPASWPGASVIGNIMQQNHIWEFDLGNSRLGFGTSSCN
ncbi:hypothetical protein BUALT_Bualt03G0097800 [Buddleja alternifolia]|uniref:Peptidase A1 domain-containing protein n=1 Tax=Buddleja alternifolia TaxID=168488 RepID=A0AAV6Y388_9LAMI|nr:hypothetical protein BUALT_Bualt03G0097800 [Buddleja alternifolia]